MNPQTFTNEGTVKHNLYFERQTRRRDIETLHMQMLACDACKDEGLGWRAGLGMGVGGRMRGGPAELGGWEVGARRDWEVGAVVWGSFKICEVHSLTCSNSAQMLSLGKFPNWKHPPKKTADSK